MKIGFVRRGYSPTGGAEAYLQRLAQGVADEGLSPMLFASREWPENAWPNASVVRVDGSSPLRFAREVEHEAVGCEVLFSLERLFFCDVYRAGDGVHRAWLERRAAFEPAWRRWIRWANRKHSELLRLERGIFSQGGARRVIANSKLVRDEIVKYYGYPLDRIDVIPNGYDAPPVEDGMRERMREEFGIPQKAFVALFAGSGWGRKGLQIAIEAVVLKPMITLLVAGKGDEFPAPPNVKFIGPRANLWLDFAAADVFVLPTIYDPFSNACLEALASGLPVVTTSTNGFSEILQHGVHGSVVAPGDSAGIFEALKYWFDNNRAAAARGECRRLAANYSIGENTRRTLETIRRAMPR
jgi:UDP-glucose:(heptosyl)LPS alpha-1,3-glucosyltransferase